LRIAIPEIIARGHPMRLLSHLLARFIRNGRLTVIDHAGAAHAFGSGKDGPDVTVRLTDAKVERAIFLNPELAFPEAYMDGRAVFEKGAGPYDLLLLFSVNRAALGAHPVQRALRSAWRSVRRLQQRNPLGQATRNIQHHYDLKPEFYRLWLDESQTYSCAYFTHPDNSLEQAQHDKMRHIAAKLRLQPGMRVLDIGCGFGALACYLARSFDVQVTGITLAREQAAGAQARVAAMGLTDRVTILEKDYREVANAYDRIVSVGMMEHVGIGAFDTYFGTVRDLLAPGGFAMIHAIGRMTPPGTTAPFIRKYIFPGGYVPALSEVFASTERAGLWVADCEILRLHYCWTIRHWRQRFEAARPQVVAMYDERFARMWEFYLGAVELGFLHGSNMVYQLLVSRNRDDVPVLRDFITDDERALAARGQ
jgi:cyclopropane-fatty-acyl-phospholipid synthase